MIYSFTRVQYLISRTVGYQAAEPNNVTEENCDTFEMFRQCCYFPALQTDIIIVVKNSYNKQLEFVSLSVSDHRSVCLLLTITLLLFMSLTIDVGRKSWKAFSVFIFSASNSLTFSITSLAKTWFICSQFKRSASKILQSYPDHRESILDKKIEDQSDKTDKRQDGDTDHFLLICCIQFILGYAPEM